MSESRKRLALLWHLHPSKLLDQALKQFVSSVGLQMVCLQTQRHNSVDDVHGNVPIRF